MSIPYIVENGILEDEMNESHASIDGRLEVMCTNDFEGINYIKGNLGFYFPKKDLSLNLPVMGALEGRRAVIILNPFEDKKEYSVILTNGQRGVLKLFEKEELSLPHETDDAETFFALNSALSKAYDKTLGEIYLPLRLEVYS